MATVTKIDSQIKIDLQLKPWELAAFIVSGVVFASMAVALVTDFSVRRLLWPDAGEAHQARAIGKVTYTLNKALRQGRDQTEFSPLAQGDAVYSLDTIMAGPGSALKITLDDRSVLEIGENSMVRLNFTSSLKLSGLNRETVVDVVAGTVAAKGGDQSVKIRSENRTFLATQDKALQLSREGGKLATAEGQEFDLVAQAKAAEARRLAELRATYAKLGGVMSPAPGSAPGAKHGPSTVSEIFSSIQKGHSDAADLAPEAKEEAKVSALANGSVQQQKVALASKETEIMMEAPGRKLRIKTEMAKVTEVVPDDNLMVKAPVKAGSDAVSAPIQLSWHSEPENAAFVVRFVQAGHPPEVVKTQADDGEVKLSYVLKRSGDYTWRIEDWGGAVLAVRSIHVNTKFQSIDMDEPVLIGRERGSKMWGAQDKWGMLFKWKPLKDVRGYRVQIARNVEGGGAGGVVAAHTITDSEFVLPYKKDWQAERMFLWVEATRADGRKIASDHIPFMFTFLPPKPRVPLNKKVIARENLNEGQLGLNWEVDSEADSYTVEIATDPHFKQKIDGQHTSENEYGFYPPGTGKYYWRVRGDKDNLSSPYSETWEFTIK